MKKNMFIGVAELFLCSIAYAGEMGPVNEVLPSIIPYVGLEGSNTWNTTTNSTINDRTSTKSTQGWGGRLSAGIIHPYSKKLRLTWEMGGGYYGSTSKEARLAGFSGNRSIDGYDLLFGALYGVGQFDVFGSVGFMAQNYRITTNIDYSVLIPGGFQNGMTKTNGNSSQILPEIKAGWIYNLNDKVGLTLAYMHVFGSNPANNIDVFSSNLKYSQNGTSNNENPTLNTILLGVRYSIS